MNKKILFTLIFIFPALLGFCQEEKINDDAFLAQKEIFIWKTTSSPKKEIYTCQAIRLDSNWFLTAAHCVYSSCKAGRGSCQIKIKLADGEGVVHATINHDGSNRHVFIGDGFFSGQNKIDSVDIALIKLDSSATYEYFLHTEEGLQEITKADFDVVLKESSDVKEQFSAMGARLVSVATIQSGRLLQRIVVPKVVQGEISWLPAISLDVYYVNDLQHFLSPGFGVKKGNSGGGVYTSNGDLVGIVSSLVYAQDGSVSFQAGEGKSNLVLKQAQDYFLFSGFNGASLNFIRNHVPNLRVVDSFPNYIEPTERNFKTLVEQIKKVPIRPQ